MINQLEKGQKQGFWMEPEGSGEWVGYYESGKKEGSVELLRRSFTLETGKVFLMIRNKVAGYKFGPNGIYC